MLVARAASSARQTEIASLTTSIPGVAAPVRNSVCTSGVAAPSPPPSRDPRRRQRAATYPRAADPLARRTGRSWTASASRHEQKGGRSACRGTRMYRLETARGVAEFKVWGGWGPADRLQQAVTGIRPATPRSAPPAGLVGGPVEPDQEQVGEAVGPRRRPGGHSSSTKKALPWARPTIWPARARPSSSATSSAISLRTASSGSGERASRSTVLQPGPLGDLTAQRVTAVEVVGAVGRDERHRVGEGTGEEETEQGHGVDWSAQWVSSMTTRSGEADAAASMRACTASKSLLRSAPGSASLGASTDVRTLRPGWSRPIAG